MEDDQYNTNKQAVDILFEYNKFTKEYNNYIESISDESTNCSI